MAFVTGAELCSLIKSERLEREAAERAQSLGFSEGWRVVRNGPRKEYIRPDGIKYTSVEELCDVLGSECTKTISSNLWKEEADKKGLQDAQEFGLPEGWRCKIYPRSKTFFSPDGQQYNTFLAAVEAAQIPIQDSLKGRQRGTQALVGKQARNRTESSSSCTIAEQLGATKTCQSTASQEQVRYPVSAAGDEDGTDAEVEQLSATATAEDLERTDRLEDCLLRLCRAGWVVLPDDVIWISPDILSQLIVSAGWVCTSQGKLRATFSGEVGLVLYADAGKLVIRSKDRNVAERIALQYVHLWLCDESCL